jgi:hypothetical protein
MTNIIKLTMISIYINKTNNLIIYNKLNIYKNIIIIILILIMKIDKKLVIINTYKKLKMFMINLSILYIMIDK